MKGAALPLLPLAAAFAVGLATTSMPGRTWNAPPVMGLLALAVLALVGGGLALAAGRLRVAAGAVMALSLAIGALRGLSPPVAPDHIAREPLGGPVRIEGRVGGEPVRRGPDRARLVLEADAIVASGERRATTGLVQLGIRGEIPPLAEGQRIAVHTRPHRPSGFRNPGGFDYPGHLARRGILVVGTARGDLIEALTAPEPPWPARVKRWAVATLGAHLPPGSAALLAGLLLGDRTGLTPETEEAFRRAGALHVLVVSGSNVALVTSTVFVILALGGLPPPARAAGAGLALVGFALVVGLDPSVVRATAMGLAVLAAVILDRESQVLNALALAGLALLAWRPEDLWDPGFQLSFAATAGIVWLAPEVTRALRERGLPVWLAAALAVSLGAQAGVTPITAQHFNHLSLIGALANLAVVPLAGGATILGLGALVAAAISTLAADIAFQAVWPVLLALRAVVWAAASVPAATVALPAPGLLAGACWYAGLAMAPEAVRSRRAAALAGGLLAGSLLLAAWPWLRPGDGLLRVTFLDVGQGDAALVELPEGQRLLVDGGPGGPHRFDAGRHVIAPFLWNLPAARLDLVVLSHPAPDHAGGLGAVGRRFGVERFWDTGRWGPGSEPTRRALEEAGVKRQQVRAGAQQRLGSALLTVLHPDDAFAGSRGDASLVLRVDWRGVSLLFVGDLGARGEALLLDRAPPLRATILKVGDHGSRSASTRDFLEAVRPAVAVISAGSRHPFRHPAPETLQRMAAVGARVYRTDLDGAVIVESDGASLWVTRWSSGARDRIPLGPGSGVGIPGGGGPARRAPPARP